MPHWRQAQRLGRVQAAGTRAREMLCSVADQPRYLVRRLPRSARLVRRDQLAGAGGCELVLIDDPGFASAAAHQDIEFQVGVGPYAVRPPRGRADVNRGAPSGLGLIPE